MASSPPLSSAQQALLKTAIQGSGDTNALLVSGDLGGLLALLNTIASPDFWVWRTAVSKDEYLQTTSVDATLFNFTGTGYITRSQGERDAFNALFTSDGFANPSLTNVRQAVADIFSGATAPAPANRTHLLAVSRRLASRFEKVFATGTGSTASPGAIVLQGPIVASAISELIGQ